MVTIFKTSHILSRTFDISILDPRIGFPSLLIISSCCVHIIGVESVRYSVLLVCVWITF